MYAKKPPVKESVMKSVDDFIDAAPLKDVGAKRKYSKNGDKKHHVNLALDPSVKNKLKADAAMKGVSFYSYCIGILEAAANQEQQS